MVTIVPPPMNAYPNSAELVHGAEGAHGRKILDDDVSGKSGQVGENAVTANLAVVANMDPRHQQIV